MKKFLILLISVLVFTALFSGCGNQNQEEETYVPKPIENKEIINQLKNDLNALDNQLLNTQNPDTKTLNDQRKELLIELAEEYVNNDDRENYTTPDDLFEDTISVYSELLQLGDKISEESSLIENLGRYIRRNIQIHFIAGNYEKSYGLGKKMYQIQPTNAGNENLYVQSATEIAKKALTEGDLEKAKTYSREATSIRYEQDALKIYASVMLGFAEKAIQQGDNEGALEYLDMAPPVDDKELIEKAQKLRQKIE